jgi:SagB-type dehydrogenase family enzyme
MTIKLDKPKIKDGLLKDIQNRKSHREFISKRLNKNQVSLILWAAAGKKIDAISSASRTVPSAGATYPIEIYLLVGKDAISGIEEGLYYYLVDEHSLRQILEADKREQLISACLGQDYIKRAPVSLILAVDYRRTTSRYGNRGIRYAHMDVGHACQNIYLMVTHLGLGTVEIGAFFDEDVKKVLNLDKNIQPLAVMPIGYIK